MKFVESSHYENTPYDVYGSLGTPAQKKLYRPIGINRNQELHILQIRNNVPVAIAGVHWLAFGPNTFNTVVPFYANVTDTPAAYRDTGDKFDVTKMYWLSNLLATFGDYDFSLFKDQEDVFEQKTVAACRHLQLETDKAVQDAKDIQAHLTAANEKMADLAMTNSNELLGQMVAAAAPNMKLAFKLQD